MSKKVSLISTGKRQGIFIELVKSIQESLNQVCEHELYWTYRNNFDFPKSDVNIIVHGKHLGDPLPKDSINILVHTEQRVKNVKGYDLVLNLFPNYGTYLPLRYSKYFDNSQNVQEDIPIYFFGALKGKRQGIRARHNVKVHHCYGEERDRLICRAKFNVNFNFSKTWMYTPLRGILVMAKGKMFFQEHASGYKYHKPYLTLFNEQNFHQTLEKWSDEKKRKEHGMYIREELMKQPFKETFLKLIYEHFNEDIFRE